MKSLLLLTLLIPSLSIAQNTITGTIISSKNKTPVAFATIGLIKQNIGTNSDEEGKFKVMSTKDFQNDTLLISSLGFESLKVPIKDFNSSITLQEKDSILQDVVVVSKKDWKTESLNDFKKCGEVFYTSLGSQTQIALKLQLPNIAKSGYVKNVKICEGRMGFMSDKVVIFRLRFYDVDTTTGSPSNNLSEKVIEVRTTKSKTTIDLQQFRIFIPSKQFFVAVEWLRIPENEHKAMAILNGVQVEHIWYSPAIGFTSENRNNEIVWHQYYSGDWVKNNGRIDGSLNISATIKY